MCFIACLPSSSSRYKNVAAMESPKCHLLAECENNHKIVIEAHEPVPALGMLEEMITLDMPSVGAVSTA